MSRIWHIRQSDEPSMYGMGYKNYESEEENEAYECGYKEGYADAMEEVKECVDYVCKNIGGHGAVREIIDMIICKDKIN